MFSFSRGVQTKCLCQTKIIFPKNNIGSGKFVKIINKNMKKTIYLQSRTQPPIDFYFNKLSELLLQHHTKIIINYEQAVTASVCVSYFRHPGVSLSLDARVNRQRCTQVGHFGLYSAHNLNSYFFTSQRTKEC